MKKNTIIFILTGLALLIVGSAIGLAYLLINGYDIRSWFSSKTAFMYYFIVAIYFGIVGVFLIKDKMGL